MEDNIPLAIIALVGTCLGIIATAVGLQAWLLKFILKKMNLTMEMLIKSVDELKEATKTNTQATKSADEYLRHRNGRDNEMHKEVMNLLSNQTQATQKLPRTIKKIADAGVQQIIAATSHIKNQSVDKQTIKEVKVLDETDNK
jgi:hypothetical protein